MNPFVSIIIPVRNESAHMRETLDAVLAQDYPSHLMEVIVADGLSSDGTGLILRGYSLHDSRIKVIENPQQTVSYGLNAAIRIAHGDVIIRMDSHSVYPPHYVSTLVKAMETYQCDNVGCLIETVPASQQPACRAIATALSHPFGVGNSWFRIGAEQVREVDTVPFGCFRREVFRQIGLFDVELVRNQDDEFNARMRLHGMKILLIPSMKVQYVARNSFHKLFEMYFQYGLFKPLVSMKLRRVASLRQLMPLGLVLSVILLIVLSLVWPFLLWGVLGGVSFYLIVSVLVSFVALRSQKRLNEILYLVWSFLILHGGYGLGYLKGIVLLPFRAVLQRTAKHVNH
ncbi:glycosyltransferase family 2 protein [Breznakibacter xylanolyticus]|nr:glycosyltransferase family 2 protein [Breznakibacter xylanolyticus]MBN2744034.1 glycosyltransferase family 2 protein [Marinilabiliaceae bacterium]